MFIVILVAALATFTLTSCATTGQRLAEQAAPQPKTFAEALKTCIEGQTSNQAVIDACTTAVVTDATRAVGTANAASEAAKPVYYPGYGRYYGGNVGQVQGQWQCSQNNPGHCWQN